MKWFEHLRIILASGSPRRAELMRMAGFNFEIRVKEVAEHYPASLPVQEIAEYLAIRKGMAQKGLICGPEEVIITADSMVLLGEMALGKPVDRDEAISMISALSDNWHEVITGVCLTGEGRQKSFSESSRVRLQRMDHDEIEYYVDTYKPYDKAGSYGIQEWIGMTHIDRIEGSYTNIMGLPMQALYASLRKW